MSTVLCRFFQPYTHVSSFWTSSRNLKTWESQAQRKLTSRWFSLSYLQRVRCLWSWNGKSLDEGEFDCSWQNLSHNFQLGRASINFSVFPKHVRVEGQDAGTVFCDPLSKSDLSWIIESDVGEDGVKIRRLLRCLNFRRHYSCQYDGKCCIIHFNIVENQEWKLLLGHGKKNSQLINVDISVTV